MPLAAVGNGLYLIAALGCPVSMGLMMWFMGHGRGEGGHKPVRSADDRAASLAELKAEQQRLAAKIAQLESSSVRAHGSHHPAGYQGVPDSAASSPAA